MRFREFRIILEDDAKDKAPEVKKPEPKSNPAFEITVPSNKYISVEIADIQKALTALGYGDMLGTSGPNKDGVDGIRGPYTRRAIQAFQKDHQLKVDGDPGPETAAELNQVLAKQPDLHITKSTEYDVSRTAQNVLNKNKETRVTDADIADVDDPELQEKIKLVADDLGINAQDLNKIIKHETNNTYSPSIQNPHTKAVGLIQFTPDTADALGTSTSELKAMSAVEQMDYVLKYYKKAQIKTGDSLGDIYMKTFLPKYATAKDSTVIGKKGGGILPGTKISMNALWHQNKIFDHNKDGQYTVGDIKNHIQSWG